MTAPGWYPDPGGRWERRWWDGRAWTANVHHQGRTGWDPPPLPPELQDVVDRVLASLYSFDELAGGVPGAVEDAAVIAGAWRDAGLRRDVLLLARERVRGERPARWLDEALARPGA